MPPRDDQEHEQRRQQIISGALQAFSAKGFAGASNRDIAEAAQIGSPGLIYHYFKDKEDLLHQVLLERMPLVKLIDSAGDMMRLPPAQALPQMAAHFIETLNQEPSVALLKVVMVESIRNPRVAQIVNRLGPGRALQLLAGYLERQMEAGQLRRMNPHIAARLLVGPLITYALTSVIFDQPGGQAIAPAEMARAAAEAFLRDLEPGAAPHAHQR